MIAAKFGVSAELDVYVALLAIHVFIGGQMGNAISGASVSNLAAAAPEELPKLDSGVIVAALVLGAVLGAAALMVGNTFVATVFPGFTAWQQASAAQLLPLIVVAAWLTCAAYALRSLQHVRGVFLPGFLGPSIVSAVIVLALWVSERPGTATLGLGLMLGWLAVVVLHGGALWKRVSLQRPDRATLRLLFMAILPLAAAEIVYQAWYVSERHFASLTGPGSLAVWAYSFALLTVFSAVFMEPATAVLLPRVTRQLHTDRHGALRYFRRVMAGFVAASALVALVLHYGSHWVVATVFQRGRFTAADTATTAEFLALVAFVLPIMTASNLLRYLLLAYRDYAAAWVVNGATTLVLVAGGYHATSAGGLHGLAVLVIIAYAVGLALQLYRAGRMPAWAATAASQTTDAKGTDRMHDAERENAPR